MITSKKKRTVAITVAAALTLSTASVLLSACRKKADNESTPLSVASDLFDGVFNPFFYTSQPDGDVVAQTQIGMLASDKNGLPTAGDGEPCVSYAYSVKRTGSREEDYVEGAPNPYENYYTDYYFALKDGLTFSDGTPLTYKDVLFNIYMYLDPYYTGSATMYSVDIQGLAAYRTQRPGVTDEGAFNEAMDEEAQKRIEALQNWALSDNSTAAEINDPESTMKADVDKVEELFKEELESSWTTAMNATIEDTIYETYGFQHQWEIFLQNYGCIVMEYDYTDSEGVRHYKRHDDYNTNVEKTKDALIEEVYNTLIGMGRDRADKTYRDALYNVITNYGTASTFRSYLIAEATRASLAENDGELLVKEVSGIEILFGQTSIAEGNLGGYNDGKTFEKPLDVLHIRINGEDPKAIQNFSFSVAPMHYYSPNADAFHYTNNSKIGDPGFQLEDNNFAVSWSDTDFMNTIRRNQVPLGAGPYRATREGGSSATDRISKEEFYKNNTAYLERNDAFLLGAPKIRFLSYQVVSQSLVYETVRSGGVHFGSPSVTSEMQNNLDNADKGTLDYRLTDTLGYGYIGINADKIDNIYLRKGIMTTFDAAQVRDYYKSDRLVSIIRRPMSTMLKGYNAEGEEESYYPEGAQAYYPFDESGKTFLAYAAEAGYAMAGDGKLKSENGTGTQLKLTFTIAGETTDHPAYNTFLKAAEILTKECGVDATVTTDSTALSKLASGGLSIWAAAWSSSSDPDMYQVYHKDSSATSILNWGFPTIERSTDDDRELDRDLLDLLAAKIEEGRETSEFEGRKKAYSESDEGAAPYITTINNNNGEIEIIENGEPNGMSALDLVMELAVEFPLYQRKTLYVFQRGLFDEATLKLFDESSAFQSPLSKIWLLSYAQ